MELTKGQEKERQEMIKKLREKYNAITGLLEMIDSEMTEFHVLLEDIDYYEKLHRS